MTIELNEQELLSQIDGDNAKQIKSKELFEYLLKQGKCYDFYKHLIRTLDYEDTLNDYICEYMDINNCFPPEDDKLKKVNFFNKINRKKIKDIDEGI